MTDFSPAPVDYLTTRRAMGYKLAYQGQMLGQFAAYLDGVGAERLTISHPRPVLGKAASRRGACVVGGRAEGVVRGFARYLSALDPTTGGPPVGLLPEPGHRIVPYIYSDADIAGSSRRREALSRTSSRPCRTLIGLIGVTGMQVGKSVRLDRDDVDLDQGLPPSAAPVRRSRQLPLHHRSGGARRLRPPTRRTASQAEVPELLHLCDRDPGAAGQRLHCLPPPRSRDRAPVAERASPAAAPRLRHSFAVRCVIGWYREGLDVERRLPLLSTWLGHVAPSSTYWYLSGVPELLELIADRIDAGLGVGQ